MTIVIGYTDTESIYMVADEAISWNNCDTRLTSISKVLRTSCHRNVPKRYGYCTEAPILIGYSGSFRLGQILECFANNKTLLPVMAKDDSTIKYLVVRFIPFLINLFEKHKFLGYTDNGFISGGTILFGMNGKLYTIQEDFSVIEIVDKYSAIGSGEPYALASMSTMDFIDPIKDSFSVETKLRIALQQTIKYCSGVSVKDITCVPVYSIKSWDSTTEYQLGLRQVIRDSIDEEG